MKCVRLGWLTLILVTVVAGTCQAAMDTESTSVGVLDAPGDSDDIVGLNPDHEAPDDEDDGYDDEYEYETDDEESGEGSPSSLDVKGRLAKALGKTSLPMTRQTVKILKKNRAKITIALFIFAFRKELGQFLLLLFTTPNKVDPDTGKVLSRSVNISPTAVLKIILFLDFMRRMQKGSDSASSALLLGPRGVLLAPLLSRLMHPMQPSAYIPPVEQHWTFERVNERYDRDAMALQRVLKSPSEIGSNSQPTSLREARSKPTSPSSLETVILLDWTKLTTSVTQMASLRDQVSFLLSQYSPHNATEGLGASHGNATNVVDTPITSHSKTHTTGTQVEVVVLLESPGGSAADYGLAAEQILRLRNEPGITLTVCVDKVAASGGYMVACCSSPGRLYAAPFAVVGSIGVIGSSINVNRVLLGWGIRPLVFRGGKDKAPVGLIGEVTRDGVAKVQAMVDSTHEAFKRHVATARPVLAQTINRVATGDTWLGCDALDAGLVDRIVSSDQYLGERLQDGARVLRLLKYERSRLLFPPIPSGRVLRHSWSMASRSLKSLVIDLPRVISKLVTLLEEEDYLAGDSGLSASAKSFTATAVQAASSL